MTRNIKLILQYDGTDYHGWQIQLNGRSIQETLQEKVRRITGEDTKVLGAGRTDAGVHAIGQVASFRTVSRLPAGIIMNALNALLPHDIRILSAGDEEEGFHPRYSAKCKTYFYLITTDRMVSPFLHRYLWRVPQELDTDVMRTSLTFLLGRHDFSSFRGSGCNSKNPVRTIMGISLEQPGSIDFMTVPFGGTFVKITIRADAFLRHMVRNIVGTLVEIGRGRMKSGDIREILAALDRRRAGPTAPARGLFLERIFY